jgi:alpha-L-rhamnosidase/Glycosyl hydrolase 2 galactose-binding domain-like
MNASSICRISAVRCFVALAGLLFGSLACRPAAESAPDLEAAFRTPPPAVYPWVYWFWLNGNITREGITADLEAMKRVGIGGVLIMDVDQGTPSGPAPFGSPQWRELFKHACAEAGRLGLEVNMHNNAGWCGSGGPWITPELAMQKIVWSEARVEGPKRFEAVLPMPNTVGNYYRDIRILAFPSPAGMARIDSLAQKSVAATTEVHYNGRSSLLPTRAAWPAVPEEETISRRHIVDLTANMDESGRLSWDVPVGKWVILRFGHTLTGKDNHPAPEAGRGLDCDKLSQEAIEAHFAGLIGKLAAAAGALTGKSFVATHIDSWETGTQNWTKNFGEEFARRRGYDLMPYFPVLSSRIVDSREVSERFLWDFRQTISEMILDNYAGHLRELANRRGLRLSIEAYTSCPVDDLAYGGRADEPMGEFWSWWFSKGAPPYGFGFTCTEMASAAHVYGKPIIGAEAFTAEDHERWQSHPANIKELGDWAFCEGINRFVFHRYAMQPWLNVKPGMAMGPWGLHYERTQTWWEMSKAWHEYLARCQMLLRQGLFVADVCYLGAEGSPQSIGNQKRFFSGSSANPDEPRDRGGYNYDLCPPEALLARMSVRDGRLVLPDGMSYRLLALPLIETMTPELLKKVKELVEEGATVVGARPVKSPSLSRHPQCDAEVKRLAEELWGAGEAPARLTARKVGKGRVFWSAAVEKMVGKNPTPQEVFGPAQWIWHPEGDPAAAVPPGVRYFRRVFTLDSGRPVSSARLMMHADNAFTCWLNGREVGSGHNFHRLVEMDLTAQLREGPNLIAVEATNRGEAPSPAGLIGRLAIEYGDGGSVEVRTDGEWTTAETAGETWNSDPAPEKGWVAAREAGPMGMEPWGDVAPTFADIQLFAEEDVISAVFREMEIPEDFRYETESGARSLRFTHRTTAAAEIYFVANKLPQGEQALCSFRVQSRRPELWRPDSGRIEHPAVYDIADGLVRMPIAFDPAGSVFVVFPKGAVPAEQRITSVVRDGQELIRTAWDAGGAAAAGPESLRLVERPSIELISGSEEQVEAKVWQPGIYLLKTPSGGVRRLEVPVVPPPFELGGPWDVRFAPNGGAPERVEFDHLISWSDHPEDGVKFYSGPAEYSRTFTLPDGYLADDRHFLLDLGRVEVMAEVKLNGNDLGVLWKPPYCVDVTQAVRPGENRLEIRVVNLFINRQIGDEFLPEDSDRQPDGTLKAWPAWLLEGKSSPTGRSTFTSWRLWHKDDPLAPSGLLGPVRLLTGLRLSVKPIIP